MYFVTHSPSPLYWSLLSWAFSTRELKGVGVAPSYIARGLATAMRQHEHCSRTGIARHKSLGPVCWACTNLSGIHSLHHILKTTVTVSNSFFGNTCVKSDFKHSRISFSKVENFHDVNVDMYPKSCGSLLLNNGELYIVWGKLSKQWIDGRCATIKSLHTTRNAEVVLAMELPWTFFKNGTC